jgi:hypothetical protein
MRCCGRGRLACSRLPTSGNGSGHDVVDSGDHKLGELEAVYVDTSTGLPSFGTVKAGMPTRHRLVFVPVAQAAVGPGYQGRLRQEASK